MNQQPYSYFRRDRTGPLAAVLLLVLAGAAPASAATQYKGWACDGGEMTFGQTIPPEQVDCGGTVFDERGMAIGRIRRTPTAEEQAQAAETARAKAREDQRRAQQQADDRTLLLMYPTVTDLLGARDRDLAAIDAVIRSTRTNIRAREQRLEQLRAEAADLERTGKTTPTHLSAGIGQAESAIRHDGESILDRERKKEQVRRDFDAKLARLRQLGRAPSTGQTDPAAPQPGPGAD